MNRASSANRRWERTLEWVRRVVLAAPVVLAIAVTGVPVSAQPPANAAGDQIRIRVRIRVLEWYLRNQLDTGFTGVYLRDVDKGGNNVASADTTFPSLAGPDEGLTAFFNRIRLGPGQIEVAIQALESTNRLKVLSEPVLTVNAKSKPAKFFSGQDIPYETLRSAYGVIVGVTEFRQTGITLSIDNAQVLEFQGDPTKRFVKMKLNVNVSRAGRDIPVAVDQTKTIIMSPQVLSRKLDTTLFIPEHSPFIAGILKSRIKVENRQGIPFLSEIPILGALFRSNSNTDMDTELIFLVTAEVLWPDALPIPLEPAPQEQASAVPAAAPAKPSGPVPPAAGGPVQAPTVGVVPPPVAAPAVPPAAPPPAPAQAPSSVPATASVAAPAAPPAVLPPAPVLEPATAPPAPPTAIPTAPPTAEPTAPPVSPTAIPTAPPTAEPTAPPAALTTAPAAPPSASPVAPPAAASAVSPAGEAPASATTEEPK